MKRPTFLCLSEAILSTQLYVTSGTVKAPKLPYIALYDVEACCHSCRQVLFLVSCDNPTNCC